MRSTAKSPREELSPRGRASGGAAAKVSTRLAGSSARRSHVETAIECPDSLMFEPRALIAKCGSEILT